MAWRKFTDEQWQKIRVHSRPPKPQPKGGRHRADERKCFEGILWTGLPGASSPLGPVSRSGGSYTDSFQVPNMINGDQLRTIRATWTVNGVTGAGTRGYSIDVLGNYEITCYNTPLETDFTGSEVTACTATSSCQWSTRSFIANFLSTQGEGGQGGVNLNGSGIDRTNTARSSLINA